MTEPIQECSTESKSPRLLILGAHPDDAEFHAGGLASIYRQLNREVKMVSVTDGSAGHHEKIPAELIEIRREESAAAAAVIGAQSVVWDFRDGYLEPTLELRKRIIHEIRVFQPDLVLTHRTCDYHPDHRAVGQAVQDASFLVTVPHVLTQTPALRIDPVVATMVDLFTKPSPMNPDIVLNITSQLDTITKMLSCHKSQVYEWLPYSQNCLDKIPETESEKFRWLQDWFVKYAGPRSAHFKSKFSLIETYEISEYARRPDEELIQSLFPNAAS
jgi:LmbE family N-acetylglucosaminyl deacetylase